jgi:TonB family protein
VTRSHVRGIDVRTSKDVDTATLRDVTDAIVRAATEAVQQWRYEAPGSTTVANAVIAIRPRRGPAPDAKVRPGDYPPHAVRVSGTMKPPAKVYDVPPLYPPAAKEAGIEGIVVMETLIDENGAIAEAHVLDGVPLLDQAALDAVKQWRFQPALMNGARVPVIMTVTISFTLDKSLE